MNDEQFDMLYEKMDETIERCPECMMSNRIMDNTYTNEAKQLVTESTCGYCGCTWIS